MMVKSADGITQNHQCRLGMMSPHKDHKHHGEHGGKSNRHQLPTSHLISDLLQQKNVIW